MHQIMYLKFTDFAIKSLPKIKKLINEHYVLSYKDKFFVMTSKPVSGLKSTFIHKPNIENQPGMDQYVIEQLHYYNPKIHILEYTAKGAAYLLEHQDKFQIESIKNIS